MILILVFRSKTDFCERSSTNSNEYSWSVCAKHSGKCAYKATEIPSLIAHCLYFSPGHVIQEKFCIEIQTSRI